MRQTIIVITIFLVSSVYLWGQANPIATVDSLFTALTRQDLFSGAMLIANDILLSKAMDSQTEKTRR